MADPASCIECTPSQETFIEDTNFPPIDAGTVKKEDALDASTFQPPDISSSTPNVYIEFCDRCRWLHRATWTSTELFLTFPAPALKSITIIPLNSEETAGRFRVWLTVGQERNSVLIWDRKIEGKFPEMKELKQRIRDEIQPGKSLGHSDKK
ncbi:hypothetical protein DENSPDRAFT_830903 [Dentipellis sp. KUC8613]|nr:hypothetical protein DENSPDRAFT_830903 [Dentipellis sp. KUC8613]